LYSWFAGVSSITKFGVLAIGDGWEWQKYIAKGPAESVKQARRVADRTSATGGQARDGLSAGLIGSGERPKSDFCHSHPSPNVERNFDRNQNSLFFCEQR
jgi:hypothetical protein